MSIEPFIGTKISLISKVGIRYEGSLHSLNTDDSTIILNDVRCMGTEGRSQGQEVQPSSKVYDFVVFRGEDVSDIVVNESKPPKQEQEFEDPAIFKTYKKDEFHNSVSSDYSKPPQPKTVPKKQLDIASSYNYEKNGREQEDKDKEDTKSLTKQLETFQFDEGETMDPNRFNINKPFKTSFKQKEEVEEEKKKNNTEQDLNTEPKVFYDKKSFYDNISHEKQLSKNDLKNEHIKQREIDIATFGKFSIRNWRNKNNAFRTKKFSNSNQFNVKAGWEKSNSQSRSEN